MADAPARPRRQALLDEIRRTRGSWPASRALAFYQQTGLGCCRNTARKDLAYWANRGQLQRHGADDNRSYTLNGSSR